MPDREQCAAPRHVVDPTSPGEGRQATTLYRFFVTRPALPAYKLDVTLPDDVTAGRHALCLKLWEREDGPPFEGHRVRVSWRRLTAEDPEERPGGHPPGCPGQAGLSAPGED